ncbi:MAG: hypothetical protein JWM04_725 [Verrucomicrobiales bacterium]|nr:hypothetical protein [Verrucomicrobiales bacterium]
MKHPSQPLYQPDDSHSHNKGTNPNSPSPNLQIASSLSESPTPLPPFSPVKNPPSQSPPVEHQPENLDLRRFFLFEKKVHRILKDISGCFKLLQVEINHLDRNDFLATNLNPAMGKASDTIHQMEQLYANQNPAFIPAKDPGPRENTLSETQEKAEQAASDEFFKPKPQPPMDTTRESKRDKSRSGSTRQRTDHKSSHQNFEVRMQGEALRNRRSPRQSSEALAKEDGAADEREAKPRVEILSYAIKESTPSPQIRNLPPEFLDYTNVRFFSKETDASKPENKMSPRMKSYMAMINKIYDEKDERDRKAAEAKAQSQYKPSNPNPDSEDARNAA